MNGGGMDGIVYSVLDVYCYDNVFIMGDAQVTHQRC